MTPEFSFLIANHNTRRFAQELLESLKNQTFPQWEAIVVDDASTDGGIKDIIENQNDARFKYIGLEKNMGASYARNIGFKECLGKYIVIVDSDDQLMPEYLAEMRKAFEQNPDANLGYVDLEYFGAQNTVVKLPLKDAEILTLEQWIPHPGLCMTKETMEKSGGYYEGNELRHGNLDWDFILSVAQNAGLNAVHVSIPLYRYRQHNANMSLSRASYESITRECIYARHKDFFDRYGHAKNFLATGYYESAAAFWAKGEYGEAIRLAGIGAELNPPPPPSIGALNLSEKLIEKFIVAQEVKLTVAGSKAFAPTEQNFNAYAELIRAYASLGQWEKAKTRTSMAIGMAAGNNLFKLAANFSAWLALIADRLGNRSEAGEAANFSLLCNPYDVNALVWGLDKAIAAEKINLALQYLKPWLKITNIAILKNIVPVFATLAKFKRIDYAKLQTRLKEIASAAPIKNNSKFLEKIYASPLGRRVIWEYRARDLYDRYGGNKGRQGLLREAVKLSNAKRVLEIGCGNGRNLEALSALGLDCVGQDISSSALELAKQRNLPTTTLYNKPLEELNFQENDFDLVVSNRVLMTVTPNEIGKLLDIMVKMGKYLYINELLPSDTLAESWYIKKYDIPGELEKRGCRLIKTFPTEESETPMLFKKYGDIEE